MDFLEEYTPKVATESRQRLTVLYPSITSRVAGKTTGGGKRSLMCPQWVLTEGSVRSQVVQFSMLRIHRTLCSLSSYLEYRRVCHQATAGESHLSSKSVVPLRDKPSSTRVRLDNLKYFQYYFHLYSLKGVKSFRLKV